MDNSLPIARYTANTVTVDRADLGRFEKNYHKLIRKIDIRFVDPSDEARLNGIVSCTKRRDIRNGILLYNKTDVPLEVRSVMFYVGDQVLVMCQCKRDPSYPKKNMLNYFCDAIAGFLAKDKPDGKAAHKRIAARHKYESTPVSRLDGD